MECRPWSLGMAQRWLREENGQQMMQPWDESSEVTTFRVTTSTNCRASTYCYYCKLFSRSLTSEQSFVSVYRV
jgi:hypothetical protein